MAGTVKRPSVVAAAEQAWTDHESKRVKDERRDDVLDSLTPSQRHYHHDYDVVDDVGPVPHTLPLLWLRTRPHTTLPCQPASGTRSQTCWLLSVYNKQNQTFHVQQRCIDAFAYVCYLYSTLCLKRRTNFETVSLEIIKIDFDDIWQKYSKDSKEFASLSVRAGLLFYQFFVFQIGHRKQRESSLYQVSAPTLTRCNCL